MWSGILNLHTNVTQLFVIFGVTLHTSPKMQKGIKRDSIRRNPERQDVNY